jgi:hypothetical protein
MKIGITGASLPVAGRIFTVKAIVTMIKKRATCQPVNMKSGNFAAKAKRSSGTAQWVYLLFYWTFVLLEQILRS